jgi:hypothetical protein
VDASGKLRGQGNVDQPMTLYPALPPKGVAHDMDPVMRLPTRPMPRMAFMQMRFIENRKLLRMESIGQLLRDEIGRSHGCELMSSVR